MGSNERRDEATVAAVTPSLFYGEKLPKGGSYEWASTSEDAVEIIKRGGLAVSDSYEVLLFTLALLNVPLAEARRYIRQAQVGLPELRNHE